ncbi:unnamed protein product, partial [Ceratitis capitata]
HKFSNNNRGICYKRYPRCKLILPLASNPGGLEDGNQREELLKDIRKEYMAYLRQLAEFAYHYLSMDFEDIDLSDMSLENGELLFIEGSITLTLNHF